VNLKRFDAMHWMTSEEDVWAIADYLCTIPHTPLLAPPLIRRLGRVDARLYASGLAGLAK